MAMLPTVDDLQPVAFRLFGDQRGVLVPVELPQSIPFKVMRFFWIFDVPVGSVRGAHGHKACHQYLICAVGSVRVEAYDGTAERSIALTAGQALHVPPALFTAERYEMPGSVLMVFCDRPYELEDYLTDRDAFVEHRKKASREPASESSS
jgi:UDP-2-acetamido-3-amino-2,3-dideoxy-glucuronate N-acetyltransferase